MKIRKLTQTIGLVLAVGMMSPNASAQTGMSGMSGMGGMSGMSGSWTPPSN